MQGVKYYTLTVPESLHQLIEARATERNVSASCYIRSVVCADLGVEDSCKTIRKYVYGLSIEEKRARRSEINARWRENNREHLADYVREYNRQLRRLRHARRAAELRMTVEEYEDLLAKGLKPRFHVPQACKPAKWVACKKVEVPVCKNADNPHDAHYRSVALNVSRQCIDCGFCSVTGKCSRFSMRVVGPHVCDCWRQ